MVVAHSRDIAFNTMCEYKTYYICTVVHVYTCTCIHVYQSNVHDHVCTCSGNIWPSILCTMYTNTHVHVTCIYMYIVRM